MKSKQLPVIEKCICLAILSVNSVYKFFEMCLSYSLNSTTNKFQLFQSNGFTGLRYEPGSLDINEVCSEEE